MNNIDRTFKFKKPKPLIRKLSDQPDEVLIALFGTQGVTNADFTDEYVDLSWKKSKETVRIHHNTEVSHINHNTGMHSVMNKEPRLEVLKKYDII